MNSTEMKHQLEERTIRFSVSVVKTLGKHSSSPTLKPLIIQIIRSATSVGANYAEANNEAQGLILK
jgi:four helix bundle protein